METTLRIKSSSSNAIYSVRVLCENENVSIFCDCNAGTFGKLCKHKLAILANDKTNNDDNDETKSFELVQEWISGSSLHGMLDEIRAAEQEVSSAQAKVKKLKKALEMRLNGQALNGG